MELANLDVAVVYQRRFGSNSYYVRTYRPSKKDAEVWLFEQNEGNVEKVERDFKIEIMPLFEVLNALQRDNDELSERIEHLEETCVTR